jgi:biotin transport system substrate-specific component
MAVNYSYFIKETADDRVWFKEALVILGASIIIALFAPISIRLPFSPVPIATQAHVVLFLACFLGSKRASLAVLTYLFQGAIGFPVFAGGAAGIMVLAGPRGGYLLGYLAAAFVTGFMMERIVNRTSSRAFSAMALGNLVVYLFGLPWLSLYVGWKNAFMLGMLPFLLVDALKLIIAAKIFKKLELGSRGN